MSDTKNIYQRINAVMKDVEYVKKDKEVDAGAGKYMAVTHDMVTAAIRKSLVEHGIVVQVTQTKGKMLQMRNVEAGIKMHLYQGDYDVDYVNIDNPSEIVRIHIQAHAGDNGDKAPGKCCSYAVKYAHLKTFSLETGEDDESRMYEAPPFTELQRDEFFSILDKQSPLDYAVFTRKHGPDVVAGLQKTFPDGKISQNKKLCQRLESEGWDMLRDYATQIGEAVDKGDSGSIIQLTEELNDDEKRVLAGLLRQQDITAIRLAKEAV